MVMVSGVDVLLLLHLPAHSWKMMTAIWDVLTSVLKRVSALMLVG